MFVQLHLFQSETQFLLRLLVYQFKLLKGMSPSHANDNYEKLEAEQSIFLHSLWSNESITLPCFSYAANFI